MFSLVVPVYNEEELIETLIGRIVPAVESFTSDYEIIFVDDGSNDKTLSHILSHRNHNKRIKALALSRNFGHQAAFSAGLEYSKGDIVAMMDGDLQDPPELLIEMYQKIKNEGFDVVNARRTGRKGENARNFYTRVFHYLYKNISEIKNIDDYGNFAMLTRESVNALLSMKEKTRYLPGLRTIIGFKQGFIEFTRENRYGGKPKMSMRKLCTLAADAIFSFSKLPVRLCLTLGLAGTIIFLVAGIYILIAKISGANIPVWSYILLSIYFLGSVQLVFLGILGEYIYRNYKESQNRPVYFIRKYFSDESMT